ncbi:hypothetical protein C8J57DRAFT_1723875 [Mycena rebaudengoi]|nr:hypothetical protein C8J57DRAFT_1723875 [Mycena rebaudengoi]
MFSFSAAITLVTAHDLLRLSIFSVELLPFSTVPRLWAGEDANPERKLSSILHAKALDTVPLFPLNLALTLLIPSFGHPLAATLCRSHTGLWTENSVPRGRQGVPWRTITLAHPELWSTIHVEEPEDIYIDDSDSSNAPTPLFLLNLALARSKNHSLTVELKFPRPIGRRGSNLPEQLIRAVVAHSNRWKTAELQITNQIIPLFAPLHNHLALLTSLSLMSFERVPGVGFPYARNAPRLTDVRLLSFAHQSLPLPWATIRHFSESHHQVPGGTRSALSTYVKLLQDNPELKTLELSYTPGAIPASYKPTLTHSLRRLVASETSLIRSLTLPRLEELVIEPKDAGTMPALRALLVRSNCTLRSLRLMHFTLDPDVLAVLANSTALRTLTIRLSGWAAPNRRTMDALMRKLAEPDFLPGLEDLDIIIGRDYDADPFKPLARPFQIGFINDAFVEMLAARWARRAAGRAHLERAFVLVELPATMGLSKTRGVGRLRKMCDEGLDVLVRARDPHGLELMADAKDISYVYDV